MQKIFKYSLPVKEKFILDLPRDARIVRAEDVDGQFFLWAIVNTEEGYPTEKRYFECYKTGQEIKTNPDHLKHVGTMKLFIMQELCLYIFENIYGVREFALPQPAPSPDGRPDFSHDLIADGKI